MKHSVKLEVEQELSRLESGSFVPRDVREFIFSLRQFGDPKSLAVEIGDFIAHPEGKRRGIAHREVQLKAYQLSNAFAAKRQGSLHIEASSLGREFFEQVVLHGIDQSRNWPTAGGITRTQAKSFLRSVYHPFGKTYYSRALNPAEVQKLEEILKNVLATADFHGGSVLEDRIIFASIRDLLGLLDHRNGTQWATRFDAIVARHAADLGVCLLCILQESELVFWNGERATTHLCVFDDGLLCLQAMFQTPGVTVAVPFYGTIAVASNYLEQTTGLERGLGGIVQGVRDGGRLTLRVVSVQTVLPVPQPMLPGEKRLTAADLREMVEPGCTTSSDGPLA